MGQVLHGCATTTEAVRRAIQNSQESLRALAKRYGINQKTVAKWKQRKSVADLPTGPKEAKSNVLSIEEQAIIIAFRRHTLLPLDDCLHALQPTIPHLTRSPLHRCLQRHGISRLPETEGPKPSKKSSRLIRSVISTSTSPSSRPPKASSTSTSPSIAPASSPSCNWSGRRGGPPPRPSSSRGRPLQDPHGSHRQWNPVHFPAALRRRADGKIYDAYVRYALSGKRHRTSADQGQASLDQWPGRTHEPNEGSDRPTLSL
ncbi:transposase [Bradyrhizobium sp. LM2.7]